MHTPSLGLLTGAWTRLTLLAALALVLGACDRDPPRTGSESPGPSSDLATWAEVIRVEPDPSVVKDGRWRDAMLATGLPWKVRDRQTGIELLLVPPGEYTRGDLSEVPDIQADIPDHQAPHALPPHRVVVDTPFYLGRTEVTIGQWSTFASETGYLTTAEGPDGEGGSTITPESDWKRDPAATWRDPSPGLRPVFPHEPNPTDPVAQISWDDAKAFSDHYGFRLPTEAEWEYAARAGSTTRYWWGDEVEKGGGGMFNVSDQSAAPFFRWPAYPFDDGHVLAAPTDRSTPGNPWGFVDILGNLQEWVSNWHDPDFYSVAKANEPVPADFDEQATGSVRAYRGGCWDSSPGQATVFVRGGYERHTDVIGFRVARKPRD